MQSLQLRIVCDLCKVETFESFEEAQAHQEICTGPTEHRKEDDIDSSSSIYSTSRSMEENNAHEGNNISEKIIIDSMCQPCILPDFGAHNAASSKLQLQPMGLDDNSAVNLIHHGHGNTTVDNESTSSTTFMNSLPPLHHPLFPLHHPLPPNVNTNENNDDDTNASDVENSWPEGMMTIPLSMEEDESNLTPKHCFVRKHCLHIFPASREFIGRKNPKGRPIVLGQIGMGCPYCLENVSRKEIREAVLFPNEIAQMYNAALCLLQRHFPCTFMPEDVCEAYVVLNRDKRRRNISKQYWVQSALKMGLVDAENGMRFKPPVPLSHNNLSLLAACMSPLKPLPSAESEENPDVEEQNVATAAGDDELTEQIPLEDPNISDTDQQDDDEMLEDTIPTEDQILTTEYGYNFISKLQRCHFIHADRFGKRRVYVLNFPGIVCNHCDARYSGQYFSILFKSFYDSIYFAPKDIKQSVIRMKSLHRRNQVNFGLVKMFYARVWKRLQCCQGGAHENDTSVDNTDSNTNNTESLSTTMIESV